MNPFDNISAHSISGLRAQAFRIQIASENIANADTHGYRRKLVTFENVFDREMKLDRVEVGKVYLDQKPQKEIFDPSHPFANDTGYVTMSNVDMMTEFADAREANRSYEAGLQIVSQARQMFTSLLDIVRR